MRRPAATVSLSLGANDDFPGFACRLNCYMIRTCEEVNLVVCQSLTLGLAVLALATVACNNRG